MLTLQDELKTAADYAALPDDREQYELIAGEIIMVPPPTTVHQDILTILIEQLGPLVRRRKLGKILPSPVNVFATEHDVYQPDLLFVRKENLGIIHMDGVHGSPDFVIEILSPSNAYYDLRLKKAIYEQIGVREYWIVDPMERSIDCYENSANGFTPIVAGKRTGRVCSVVIPEFCVEVEEVFSL
jgi:Uma2 family endonuclease